MGRRRVPGRKWKGRQAVRDGGWVSLDGVVALCCYCERQFLAHELTWEHVIPKALGGGIRGNLRLACRPCNQAEGVAFNRELRAVRFWLVFHLVYAPRRARGE